MDEKRQQDIRNAGIKSRHAMAWLRDHKLPSDPVCYTLAYEYLHSDNAMLKQKLEAVDMSHIDSLDTLHQIYEECIIASKYQNMAMACDNENQYVAEILNLLLHSQDKIEDFQPILNAVKAQIKEPVAPAKEQQASASDNQSSDDQILSELELAGSPEDYIQVKTIASRDPKTGLLDVAGMQQVLDVCTKYAENYPVAVLKFDLDQFKIFVENHGSLMANGVIKHTAKTLENQLKGSDIVVHSGDDEYMVLLPKTANNVAVAVADKLRKVVAGLTLKKKNSTVQVKFTVSAGVSEMTLTKPLKTALAKANVAMDRSKDLGRNCVNTEL